MLHELQTSFLKGIYNKSLEDIAYPFIKETSGKSAEQQISIYRGSIFGGLKKALAETYPVTKELVGDDFYNMMLGEYIKTYPCQVQDLNDYGEELPDFIRGLKQARSIPYLADIAQLEWFCNSALNTEIQKNNLVDLEFLNTKQITELKLNLPNGSALLQSNYPVDEIWEMHQNDIEKELELTEELVNLIVWNSGLAIKVDKLTLEQFCFLDNINKGLTFVDVCSEVISSYPHSDINLLFSNALQYGWLQSFEV